MRGRGGSAAPGAGAARPRYREGVADDGRPGAPQVPGPARQAVLRRAVLVVAVLDDVDVEPADAGPVVRHPAGRLQLDWAAIDAAVGAHAPESGPARRRLAAVLRLAARLAGSPPRPAEPGADPGPMRALALPPGHVLHPGPGWPLVRVPGGQLDLGLGVLDAGGEDAPAEPLGPALALALGLDTDRLAGAALAHLARMGQVVAAPRLRRDGPGAVLRPVAGCDALTLLAAEPVRRALAEADGSGMAAVAAPMRSRAWSDLRRVDPAYVVAAWAATDPDQRGLAHPVLVTADGVHAAGGPHRGDDADATVRQSLDRGRVSLPRPRR